MWRSNFVGLLLFAFIVRLCVAWLGREHLADDPDAYTRLAINWAASGVLGIESGDGLSIAPTAYRPPLYPWILSWFVSEGKLSAAYLIALHVGLGWATIGLTLSIARALRQDLAWLAALAVTVDPILLRQSQLVMTETLAVFLSMLAWRLWLIVWPARANNSCDTYGNTGRSRLQWFSLCGFAIVMGVSILARPTAAAWLALVLLSLFFVGCSCWKRRINDCALVALLATAVVIPWTLRNVAAFNKPIWGTTHGGYTLLLANNPQIFEHFRNQGPTRNWNAEPFHRAWDARTHLPDPHTVLEHSYWFEAAQWRSGEARPVEKERASPEQMDEVSDDRLAYSAAWAAIRAEPTTFLLGGLYRVGWLWAAWPHTDSALSKMAIGIWYTCLFLLALPGGILATKRCGLRAWLPPLMLAFSLSAVHAVYWSNMRMRAPLMPIVCIAANESLSRIFRGGRSRRQNSQH
jgi:hypothetical protein